MPRAVDNSPFANASSDSSIRVRKSKIGTHMFDEVEAHVEKMSPKVRGALRSRSSARTRYFLAVVDSSRTVITRMAFGSRLLRTFCVCQIKHHGYKNLVFYLLFLVVQYGNILSTAARTLSF